MSSLKNFLDPTSVAIVGASNNSQKIGGIVLKNIIEAGYKGKVFPVNPKETIIQNLPTHANLNSLPVTPDLAIFAVPSSIILPLLAEAGEKKIKNILIFSAGFKESGSEGKELEEKLLAISSKYNFNILGPNCLGFVNNSVNLNATFGKVSNQNGNLRVLSQSGAIATSFFDWATKNQIGLNQFITLGNKSVLNENHFLEYFLQNPIGSSYDKTGLSNLQPIGLYLESISDGPEFTRLSTILTKTNPVFIIKPGKSVGAANAMMSHTGSLAGSDEVLSCALKESGIIKCDTLEDFFNTGKTLSWESAPKGPNVAIISNAGGPAVISADAVETFGLKLATLSQNTNEKLKTLLPRMAGLHNPIDVLGDALADRYQVALTEVLSEEGVDSVLVILTPQIMTEIEKTAQIIGELSKKFNKPILCSFIGGSQVEIGESTLNSYKIPNFSFPEQALKTLSLIYSWVEYKNKSTGSDQKTQHQYNPTLSISRLDKFLQESDKGSGLLDPKSTSYLLELAQINEPVSVLTSSLDTAKEFAVSAGWPIVLKVSTKNLLHKSDSGGVITNIKSLEELGKQWVTINQNNQDVLVQKQILEGQELIIGFKRDDDFGNTLFFGAGGKFVSLFKDKNLSLFPLTEAKLENLIKNSKIYPLLNGYRGDSPLDIQKIISLCFKLGFVFEQLPQIKDMEINPVILNSSGIYAVDTKIILSSRT